MNEITAALRLRRGLDLSRYDESFLAQSIEKRRKATIGETPRDYLQRLITDDSEVEAFTHALHINYSEFFRNPLAFSVLEQLILPKLIMERTLSHQREIRIWSAGCAAGQEVWSVAILLDELLRLWETPLTYRILATDLSEADLQVARAGVYSPAALGNVRLRHLNGYFTRHGESYSLVDRLKARVDFSVYDLLDAGTTCPPISIYGAFDLVLCNNVLLYYSQETQRFLLEKFRHCLATGGYLMTGETERQIVENTGGFHAVAPPASVFG